MKKIIVFMALLAFIIFSFKCQSQNVTITIKTPKYKESVSQRPMVEGIASGIAPNSTIWVVVHPLDVSDYWVQPPAVVREDSTWKTKIYVGEPGSNIGELFEIKAFAGTEHNLTEGQSLSYWPKAKFNSSLIEVKRK